MPTLANSPADELVWSEASVDVTTRASSIDMFIGSRVPVKRLRVNHPARFSELLDTDCDTLDAHEAAELLNARLCFRLAIAGRAVGVLFSRL